MTMSELCNNNKLLDLRLTVKSRTNSGDHPIYGSVTTSTREIEMLPEKEKVLQLKDVKGKPAGTVKFNVF